MGIQAALKTVRTETMYSPAVRHSQVVEKRTTAATESEEGCLEGSSVEQSTLPVKSLSCLSERLETGACYFLAQPHLILYRGEERRVRCSRAAEE
jgi:hypothetical protein